MSFATAVIDGLTWPGTIRTVAKGNKAHLSPMHPELHTVFHDYVLSLRDLDRRDDIFGRYPTKPLKRWTLETIAHRWGALAEVKPGHRTDALQAPALVPRPLEEKRDP